MPTIDFLDDPPEPGGGADAPGDTAAPPATAGDDSLGIGSLR